MNYLIWKYKELEAKIGDTVYLNGVKLLVTKRTNICDIPSNSFVIYKVPNGFYFRMQDRNWCYAGIEVCKYETRTNVYMHGGGIPIDNLLELNRLLHQTLDIVNGTHPTTLSKQNSSSSIAAAA